MKESTSKAEKPRSNILSMLKRLREDIGETVRVIREIRKDIKEGWIDNVWTRGR